MRNATCLILSFAFAFSVPLFSQVPSPAGSLILHLPLDGNADDVSGNANNGTVYGATLTSDRFGNPNSAYLFNGTTDKIVVPNSPSLNPVDQLTITFWLRVDSMVNNRLAVLHKGGVMQGYFANREYAVYLKANYDYPYFELMSAGDQSGQHEAFSRGHTIQIWRFFAGVIDRRNHVTRIYVDSTLDTQVPDSYSTFNANSDPLTLGWEADTTFPDHSGLCGAIDDVRLYATALTNEEIAGLYSNDTVGRIQTAAGMSFGKIPVGSSANQPLVVENVGGGILSVAGLELNNPVFTVPSGGFQLQPYTSRTVMLSYAPATASTDSATLSIASSDPQHPLVRVHLSGKGHVPIAPPVIAAITDIPNDNGHQVRVSWYPSKYDGVSDSLLVSSYNLYRRVEGDNTAWDFVATIPAERLSRYYYVAPTLHDANSLSSMHWSVFRLSARVLIPPISFFSDPDSGYSVDGISPGQPSGLNGITIDRKMTLSWDSAGATDVDYYLVFRGLTDNFVPSATTLIGSTKTNSYTDTSVTANYWYYYSIVAVDESGNWSPPSRPWGGIVLSVAISSEIPHQVELSQNYPNPFNPSTLIRFAIPRTAYVKLQVFNTLGQHVATLAEGEMAAGYHEVKFDGTGRASGIYFYRLLTGDVVQMHKMLLLK